MPGDIALLRQHAALAGVSGQNWHFKISFRQPRTAGLPMAFSYGRWDQNRSPDDATPYASQHSQQSSSSMGGGGCGCEIVRVSWSENACFPRPPRGPHSQRRITSSQWIYGSMDLLYDLLCMV
jgi:hypothetical protein